MSFINVQNASNWSKNWTHTLTEIVLESYFYKCLFLFPSFRPTKCVSSAVNDQSCMQNICILTSFIFSDIPIFYQKYRILNFTLFNDRHFVILMNSEFLNKKAVKTMSLDCIVQLYYPNDDICALSIFLVSNTGWKYIYFIRILASCYCL